MIYKALMSDLHFYANDCETVFILTRFLFSFLALSVTFYNLIKKLKKIHKSSRLSEECLNNCANNVLKSHCLYQLARVAHVKAYYLYFLSKKHKINLILK